MKRSTNSIHGLPAKAYINREFWETECNTVLADGWTFVGFVHEFLNPGDVIPISIGGKPILLIKNAKKQIAAFAKQLRATPAEFIAQPTLALSTSPTYAR